MKKLMMIISICCLIMTANAQDIVGDFMKNSKNPDVFTQVNINSKMFRLIADMAYADTESIIQNLTGMKILKSEKDPGHYFEEAKKLIEKRFSIYENLMNIKEEEKEVWMYIQENKGAITELVILVKKKDEFVLMSFMGKIDLKKISQLSKSVHVDGMEYLDKVKEEPGSNTSLSE